jgi:hypothetical protein
MKLSSRDLGIALALSAAGVVAATATGCTTKSKTADSAATKDVHICAGKNTCKALGGCKTEKNSCAGLNACKGLGGCAIPKKH